MKRQRNAAIRRIGVALAAAACLMTTQAAHAAELAAEHATSQAA